jgi:hypothetical protein
MEEEERAAPASLPGAGSSRWRPFGCRRARALPSLGGGARSGSGGPNDLATLLETAGEGGGFREARLAAGAPEDGYARHARARAS